LLHKFRAARAAAQSAPAAPTPAPAPAPAPPAGPVSVESLGQQLREVLPTRRLHSVSLCDHEANCLWLSEGALGPDEHLLVTEALEVLGGDAALPCHETALEDGRLAVFLPVRAPMGNLVGIAMVLADSKSIGDDTLERMTAAPVRTIMQRLAILLKPSDMSSSASLGAVETFDADEAPEDAEPAAAEAGLAFVAEVAEISEPSVEAELPEAELPEVEVTLAPVSAPAAEPEMDEDISETIITAAEIAKILELELVADEPPPTVAAAEPAPAPARAPARPVSAAPEPTPVPVDNDGVADSGMLKLEFLAEPPVVRPAPNPTAVAKKLHAASKAAGVAPTRGPRPLPTTPVARTNPPAPAPAAKGKPPAPTPVAAPPAAKAAPAAGAPLVARTAFEPVPAHSHLSLTGGSDDVVVLFDSEPVQVPSRPGAPPAKAAPAASAARTAPPSKPAQSTRIPPAQRIQPPARSAPAVRTAAPVPRPAAAAPRTVPAARAPAPSAQPPPAVPAAPAPAAVPVVMAAPPAPAPVAAPAAASPAINLVPFAKLRAGGQNRRFQVQPRGSASDEQTVQQLIAWLAANRSQWNAAPTTFTINLSIATLEDERFLGKIGAALNTHGVAGETLGFEIAESLCLQERAKVERFMTQCEKLGAWIVIDDFTFDSQVLPLLRSKALRMLKLDTRLTAAALRDKLSQAVVVATVQAAKVLGIHCSAKKADSHALLQYLAAIGLDYAQGAALSRTVALEAIATATDARPSGLPDLENN